MSRLLAIILASIAVSVLADNIVNTDVRGRSMFSSKSRRTVVFEQQVMPEFVNITVGQSHVISPACSAAFCFAYNSTQGGSIQAGQVQYYWFQVPVRSAEAFIQLQSCTGNADLFISAVPHAPSLVVSTLPTRQRYGWHSSKPAGTLDTVFIATVQHSYIIAVSGAVSGTRYVLQVTNTTRGLSDVVPIMLQDATSSSAVLQWPDIAGGSAKYSVFMGEAVSNSSGCRSFSYPCGLSQLATPLQSARFLDDAADLVSVVVPLPTSNRTVCIGVLAATQPPVALQSFALSPIAGGVQVLKLNSPVQGTAPQGTCKMFVLPPAASASGCSDVTLDLTAVTGDVDLFVSTGQVPTVADYTYSSARPGSERLVLPCIPPPARYIVCVYGFGDRNSFRLVAKESKMLTPPPAIHNMEDASAASDSTSQEDPEEEQFSVGKLILQIILFMLELLA